MNKENTRILITGGSGFIGTNLIDDYIKRGIDFINVDWNAPLKKIHQRYWENCDIMNYNLLMSIAQRYQPTVIIHLAARTDTDIYDLQGDLQEYVQNTTGTKNILMCAKQLPGVQRIIVTSSMFVCKAGYMPEHDEDFSPFTLYGVSKMLTEKYTREATLPFTWTIIRPQTIWGPWSMRYKNTLFKVMKRGLYFHPDKRNVHRAYGYVGNVVWQINQILSLPSERVHQKVLYVGDRAINLLEWAQSISRGLTGQSVRTLPSSIVHSIAVFGDVIKKFNISFPITTTRYNSMVQDYLTPVEQTFQILGEPPYSLQEGVDAFIKWHEHEHNEEIPEEKRIMANLIPTNRS